MSTNVKVKHLSEFTYTATENSFAFIQIFHAHTHIEQIQQV